MRLSKDEKNSSLFFSSSWAGAATGWGAWVYEKVNRVTHPQPLFSFITVTPKFYCFIASSKVVTICFILLFDGTDATTCPFILTVNLRNSNSLVLSRQFVHSEPTSRLSFKKICSSEVSGSINYFSNRLSSLLIIFWQMISATPSLSSFNLIKLSSINAFKFSLQDSITLSVLPENWA